MAGPSLALFMPQEPEQPKQSVEETSLLPVENEVKIQTHVKGL